MRDSTGASSADPASWLFAVASCCTPLASCLQGSLRRSKSSAKASPNPTGRMSQEGLLEGQDDEKQTFHMVHDQPPYQARPVAVPGTEPYEPSWRERMSEKNVRPKHHVFSARSRLWSDASSRRPLISAPSEFRHLNSGSFQFPQEYHPPLHRQSYSQCGGSLRPLELSTHMPDNRTSPILTHFDYPGTTTTPPPPAYFASRADDDHPLVRQRSYSSMSFHIPRRHVRDRSPSTIQGESPPQIPPKAPGRSRAYTAPEVEAIKERVASAMIEVERLQQQIEDVIERQSLYTTSRPSTSHTMARTMPDLESMPAIPARPPAAPSFAERLNADFERPHTAPIKPASFIAGFTKPLGDPSVTPQRRVHLRPDEGMLPPPPLPLVLRPPLRKKKSFSRVSAWLFTGAEQNSDMSSDAITNNPRPVKGSEGFYQCIEANEFRVRQSFDSLDSCSTWETDAEQRTAPTTWSPGSAPVTRAEEARGIERRATFGRKDARPEQSSIISSVSRDATS